MSAGRLTYTDLFNDFLQNTGNLANSADTNLIAFFKRHLTSRYQLVLSKLTNYTTQKTKTASTVADQQFYHYPPGVVNIESATVTVGGVAYPLNVINSQKEWDKLNELDFSDTAIPTYLFPRRDDFGIWPVPQDAYTITFNSHLRDRSLTTADYTTGTVTATQNSATLTGSGTTWTAAMVGRWFKVDNDGYWYRISAFGSTTSLTIESVYEGTTVAGATYVIGESPEIPEEGHILISYGVTADYFGGPKKDKEQAKYWENMFWTGSGSVTPLMGEDMSNVGGLMGLQKKYASRSDSRLIKRRSKGQDTADNKIWATTLS
jgi:hypothetical protein